MFDNLRRSLVPLTTVLFLVVGWYTAPQAGTWLVTSAAMLLVAGPLLAFGLSTLTNWRPGEDWRQSVEQLTSVLVPTVIQRVLALCFLPLRARYSSDAIGRTLYRLFVSRRHLLKMGNGGGGGAAVEACLRVAPAVDGVDSAVGGRHRIAIAGRHHWVAIPIVAC